MFDIKPSHSPKKEIIVHQEEGVLSKANLIMIMGLMLDWNYNQMVPKPWYLISAIYMEDKKSPYRAELLSFQVKFVNGTNH